MDLVAGCRYELVRGKLGGVLRGAARQISGVQGLCRTSASGVSGRGTVFPRPTKAPLLFLDVTRSPLQLTEVPSALTGRTGCATRRKLHSWSTFLDRVPGLRSANRARLVVSLAESSIIRKVALPVTVPLKLWVAWQAVTLARGTHVLPP